MRGREFELGWFIFNRNAEGNKEGEYTRLEGDKGIVIDYVIGDDEIREGIVRLWVEDHIDLDHFPIIVKLGGKRKKEKRCNKFKDKKNRKK